MRTVVGLLWATLFILASNALAIELRPYPTDKITERQWSDYFAQVKAAYAASMQELPDQHLVVFHDDKTATSYAFTQPGHPAHPAWITRHIVQEGSNLDVDQIGYFAGAEAPFAVLFQQYQATNRRMIEEMKRQNSGR